MTFIIAEISSNHGGDLTKAKEMIRAAAKCGCDAVKFQFFNHLDLGESFDPGLNLMVPYYWLTPLFHLSHCLQIKLFASVFSAQGVRDLAPYRPFAFKIASPASTALSWSTYEAIANAVRPIAKLFISADAPNLAKMRGLNPDVLFYCKPGYPAHITADDSQYILTTEGFSDHSPSIVNALTACERGIQYIERHFRIDDECVDLIFSSDPAEMSRLCAFAHK